MKEYICEFCGVKLTPENAYEHDGKTMCISCFNDKTEICNNCGERIWLYSNAGSGHLVLCTNCFENHYTYCEECGCLIHNDCVCYENGSDIPYCSSCYNDLFEKTIKNYSYKPEPIFYGEDDLFMGVELEIDMGGENHNNAEDVIHSVNYDDEHIYCKHDGSLEEGFEIVSHPMTLKYHKDKMPWQDVMNTAIELGYRSHQTSTCGLHIHVGREELGDTYAKQEDVISRIVYFVEAHWNELLKFSRRTEYSINRWARRYGLLNNTKDTYTQAKKGTDMGRYVCLNLYNPTTIEFRIFRGTLKYSTFIATLELVHEICKRAMCTQDEEWERMCWSDFVSKIDKEEKKTLIEYLKSKQLYVNELNESEEEI